MQQHSLPYSYSDRSRARLRRNLKPHGVADIPRIAPCPACGGRPLAMLCVVSLGWTIRCTCGRAVTEQTLDAAAVRWREGA